MYCECYYNCNKNSLSTRVFLVVVVQRPCNPVRFHPKLTTQFKIASRVLPWFSSCLFTTTSNRNVGFPTLISFETLFPYHTLFFTAPNNRIPFYFLPFAIINLLIIPLENQFITKEQIQCIIESTECLSWRISNYLLGSPLEISSSSCFLGSLLFFVF